MAGNAVVIFPFVRRWRLPGGVVRARWVDGEPAAVERQVGDGCLRDVAIEIPAAGDLVLTPAFGQLLRALSGPCTSASPPDVLPDSALAWLTRRSAAGQETPVTSNERSPIAPWLLGAALALALLEPFTRRREKAPQTVERTAGQSDLSRLADEASARSRALGGSR
jgi:hypothetical protein